MPSRRAFRRISPVAPRYLSAGVPGGGGVLPRLPGSGNIASQVV